MPRRRNNRRPATRNQVARVAVASQRKDASQDETIQNLQRKVERLQGQLRTSRMRESRNSISSAPYPLTEARPRQRPQLRNPPSWPAIEYAPAQSASAKRALRYAAAQPQAATLRYAASAPEAPELDLSPTYPGNMVNYNPASTSLATPLSTATNFMAVTFTPGDPSQFINVYQMDINGNLFAYHGTFSGKKDLAAASSTYTPLLMAARCEPVLVSDLSPGTRDRFLTGSDFFAAKTDSISGKVLDNILDAQGQAMHEGVYSQENVPNTVTSPPVVLPSLALLRVQGEKAITGSGLAPNRSGATLTHNILPPTASIVANIPFASISVPINYRGTVRASGTLLSTTVTPSPTVSLQGKWYASDGSTAVNVTICKMHATAAATANTSVYTFDVSLDPFDFVDSGGTARRGGIITQFTINNGANTTTFDDVQFQVELCNYDPIETSTQLIFFLKGYADGSTFAISAANWFSSPLSRQDFHGANSEAYVPIDQQRTVQERLLYAPGISMEMRPSDSVGQAASLRSFLRGAGRFLRGAARGAGRAFGIAEQFAPGLVPPQFRAVANAISDL